MFKKTLALLLAALLAAGTLGLSGCSESKSDSGQSGQSGESAPNTAETSDTAPAETQPVLKSGVPDGTVFGGRTFTMACSDFNQYHTSTVEELNGEVLNDAIYNMRSDAEGLLDVKITETAKPVHELTKIIANMVMSGDSSYDAVTHLDRYAVEMMLGGSLLPLDKAAYISLDREWWNPVMSDALSLGGNSFYAVSSYNILTLVYTSCLYFNSSLLKNLGSDSSELYAKVEDGTWTYSALDGYLKTAASDVNGDGEMNEGDRFGISSYDWNCFGTTVLASCGQFSTLKDSEGVPYMAWNGEKYENALKTAYDIINGPSAYTDSERYAANCFTSGQSLFMASYFYATSALTEMDDDYGIIPPPKYEESQDGYFCETYDAMYSTIPISASDPEFSGAVLETLSFNGYNSVIDAYIESTMKYKKTRDEKSVDMIQRCIDGRVVDIGVIYLYDYASYDALYNKVLSKSSFGLAAYTAKTEETANKRLEEIMQAVRGEK